MVGLTCAVGCHARGPRKVMPLALLLDALLGNGVARGHQYARRDALREDRPAAQHPLVPGKEVSILSWHLIVCNGGAYHRSMVSAGERTG